MTTFEKHVSANRRHNESRMVLKIYIELNYQTAREKKRLISKSNMLLLERMHRICIIVIYVFVLLIVPSAVLDEACVFFM